MGQGSSPEWHLWGFNSREFPCICWMCLLIPKDDLDWVSHLCIDIISCHLLVGKSFFSGSLWIHICHTDASLEDIICYLLGTHTWFGVLTCWPHVKFAHVTWNTYRETCHRASLLLSIPPHSWSIFNCLVASVSSFSSACALNLAAYKMVVYPRFLLTSCTKQSGLLILVFLTLAWILLLSSTIHLILLGPFKLNIQKVKIRIFLLSLICPFSSQKAVFLFCSDMVSALLNRQPVYLWHPSFVFFILITVAHGIPFIIWVILIRLRCPCQLSLGCPHQDLKKLMLCHLLVKYLWEVCQLCVACPPYSLLFSCVQGVFYSESCLPLLSVPWPMIDLL